MSDDRDDAPNPYAADAELESPDSAELSEELPPVRPPSAGFIAQLFLIPALIVGAVVGVWALFGKMAGGDQDWRELVSEIRNTNEHRRWRGANGLATLLDNDQQLGKDGQHLAQNPEIAAVLVDLFREGLHSHSQREDDLKQQAFLARTLGLSDVTTTTFPALREGFRPDQDLEVRKNSLAAVAVAAGRALDRKQPITDLALVGDLVGASSDADSPLVRQLGAFALGQVPSSESSARLTVLLGDGDPTLRVNAAIALARQESTAGLVVFREVFRAAADASPGADDPAQLEKMLSIKNGLKAVRDLSQRMSAAERAEFAALIEPIAASHPELRLRTDATAVLLVLKAAGAESSTP